MRRTAWVSCLCVVVLLGGQAANARRSARIETSRYDLPGGFQGVLGTYGRPGGANVGGARFEVRRERSVKVKVVDDLGLPTAAQVTQDLDGDSWPDSAVDICGSSEGRIKIVPRKPVTIYVVEGPCADGTPAAASSGVIEVAFGR